MDILGLVKDFGHVRASLQTTGGFTLDTVTGSVPLTGYALSLNPDRTLILDYTFPTVGDLLGYALDNEDLLSKPDKYFGAWVDTESNKLYLDVVTVLQVEGEALELAKSLGEIAIYDLTTSTEIRVDYSEGNDK